MNNQNQQKKRSKSVENDTNNDVFFDNLDLMTVEEVSQLFGKAPGTIKNWVVRRQIPALKVMNKIYFRRSVLNAWLKEKEI